MPRLLSSGPDEFVAVAQSSESDESPTLFKTIMFLKKSPCPQVGRQNLTPAALPRQNRTASDEHMAVARELVRAGGNSR